MTGLGHIGVDGTYGENLGDGLRNGDSDVSDGRTANLDARVGLAVVTARIPSRLTDTDTTETAHH